MAERRELKYLISIRQKNEIISFLKHFCIMDSHIKTQESYYEVLSTYYDSPNFKSYAEKINGEKNRIKFRIRKYGDNKLKYIELKRKFEDIIIKSRIKLENDVNIFEKKFIESDLFKSKANQEKQTIHEAIYLKEKYALEPKINILYNRTALIDIAGTGIRITIDQDLRCAKVNDEKTYKDMYEYFVDRKYAVLEIKLNRQIPKWVYQLVKSFNLTRTAFSKYQLAIERVY